MEANISDQKGSVNLDIAQALSAKTIQPNVDMTIATYTITGNGPEGTNFTKTGVTSNNLSITDLAQGAWTIIVDAINKDNIKIASGSTSPRL